LQEIPDEQISFYKTGDEFIDMCRGPHLSHTGNLKVFKLTGINKVHWMDDPNRPILYKISGLAFNTQEELDEYLEWESEKVKKEHQVIGPQRDYFNFRPNTIGPGLPVWLNEGNTAISLLTQNLRRLRNSADFIEVSTPAIAKVNLFKETGHFEFYQEQDINPFKIHNELYMLRPMATPSHIEVFRSKRHGVRNLPYKIFEMAKLYREEASEELNGLARTREFTQDTAHIFIDKAHAVEEVENTIELTLKILNFFGFKDYRLQFARRDKRKNRDYLGTEESWDIAEKILIKALEGRKLAAREAVGEAEFYGPKIDFLIKDIQGKEWQVSTIQMDLVTPKRTNLVFRNKSGKDEIPYIIHHSAIGSIERFFALLLEFYSGALPLWLAPTQVVIITVSEDYSIYAKQVYKELLEANIRVRIDTRPETLANKIRQAQSDEIPYMIILGKQEQSSDVISVRPRTGQEMGIMKVPEFLDMFSKNLEISNASTR
jgi:threonyl-tRNA synthetase